MVLERFKEGQIRQIVGLLNRDVIPDLLERLEGRLNRIASRGFDAGVQTTRRFRDMIAAVDVVIESGRRLLAVELREDLFGLARREAQWQSNRLAQAFSGFLPPDFSFDVPSPALLRSIVTSRPMRGRFLRDEWRDWDRRTRVRVRRAINVGLAEGDSVAEIVRRLRGTRAQNFADGVLQASRHDAARIVRTAVNHVSSHARQATFAENDDVVDRVQWVSTLDLRTSEICAALDGRTFALRSGPRPPAHHQCRSTIVPVVKPFSELGIPGLRDIERNGSRHAREVFTGRVPERVTFPEWWRGLSKAKQNEVFGPGKAALLREGRISFRQLIDQRLRPLTLEQLERVAESVAA